MEIHAFHKCEKAQLEDLHQIVKQSFAIDSFGVNSEQGNGQSKEDIEALEIMESTVAKKDRRWEIGLLWRTANVKLPNNSCTAMMRLH